MISLITIGPTLGPAFGNPAPVRNWVTLIGLSTPKVRLLSAAKSTPVLVMTRPNETPFFAAPKETCDRLPVRLPSPSASDRNTESPCAELSVNGEALLPL